MSDINVPKLDWRVILNRAAPAGRRGWGRVRAAQLLEMRRAYKVAIWGQAINAALLVVMLDGAVPRAHLAFWLLLLAFLMLVTSNVLREWRDRPLHSVSRKAIDRAAYHAVFFGAVWSIPASYVFGAVGHTEQFAICLITISMMAGAAFVFATLPAAAGAYIIIVGCAVSNMLSTVGSPLMAACGPLYMAGLFLMVISNGRAFMQRKCVEIALEERTETVSLLLGEYESSDADWLWQTNGRLDLQNISSRFARAIGRSTDKLEGTSILELLPRRQDADPATARALKPLLASLRNKTPFTEIVVPIAGSDGIKSIELSAQPRYNKLGRFIGYRGVGSDVTEERRAADRIQHMARHDALTGLPNRLQLTEELGAALEQAERKNGQCAILLIDLDRFKTVNDSLGHVAGDSLLRQVSQKFAPLLSASMTAGRLGGDEFALIVPDADANEINRLGQAIIDALKEPFFFDDQHLFVGASIGAAFGPLNGNSVEELIRNADLALYRAKEEGGNDIRFYEPDLHAKAEERRQIELALRSAMAGGEFSLVYQPIVDAGTSAICCFEALLRWTNPVLGSVPPARFIPVAEETGLIGRIGEWVLRTACAEAVTWPADISLAVNVSPRQLQDPTFVLTLVTALSQSGLDPHRLELEITETVFLNVTPQTQTVLRQIRGLGIRLAMDDFGTGYSSLGYLREAAFDVLKVDRSFVEDMSGNDPESGAIIRAVVALASSLGMKTVAEGVETEEQLELVRALGCDLIQGFVISDPLSAFDARVQVGGGKGRVAAA